MSKISPVTSPSSASAVLLLREPLAHDPLAGPDQAPQRRLFLDDPRVVLDVADVRHAVEQRRRGRPRPPAFSTAPAVEFLLQRQHVDLGRTLRTRSSHRRDRSAGACRGKKSSSRQDRHDERERRRVEQDRAEDGALGLEVLRQPLFGRRSLRASFGRPVTRFFLPASPRSQRPKRFPQSRSAGDLRASGTAKNIFSAVPLFSADLLEPCGGQMMSEDGRTSARSRVATRRKTVLGGAHERDRRSAIRRCRPRSADAGRGSDAARSPPRRSKRGAHAPGLPCLARTGGRRCRRIASSSDEPPGDERLEGRVEPDERHADPERRRGGRHRGGFVEASSASRWRSRPRTDGPATPLRVIASGPARAGVPASSAVPTTPPGCLRPSGVPWKSLPAVTRRLVARESAEPRLLVRAVVGMEDLERVEALRGEGPDQRLRVSVPDRVGERRDAAGVVDRLAARPRPATSSYGTYQGCSRPRKPVEGLVVGRRVPGPDERPREMRASPDAVADVLRGWRPGRARTPPRSSFSAIRSPRRRRFSCRSARRALNRSFFSSTKSARMWTSSWPCKVRPRSRRPEMSSMPRFSASARASGSPCSVSWSVSAKASIPASLILRTSSAGESSPSETVEWLWRSILIARRS